MEKCTSARKLKLTSTASSRSTIQAVTAFAFTGAADLSSLGPTRMLSLRQKIRASSLLLFFCCALLSMPGCGSSPSMGGGTPPPPPPALVILVVSPQNPAIADGGATQAFTATGSYSDGSTKDLTATATWTSSNTNVATVSASGSVTSLSLVGSQAASFTSIQAAVGSVKGVSILSVTNHAGSGFAGVFTQHNDLSRTGQNVNETILTPAVVGSTSTFGKVFSQPVDGYIYAQPLYVPGVSIPNQGTHNIIFVATEGDSVFAFDADTNAGANSLPLWQASLIDTAHGAAAGASTVSSANDLGCGDLVPQVGITSTPVIDPSTNTMYVEAKSKENGVYVHRLHALDITTGGEKSPGPIAVTATVSGTGDGSAGGSLTFDPLHHMNRSGLLLVNGQLYLAYASHCDYSPYHGWLFAYDAGSFTQKGVYVTTPNGGLGGFWMAGSGVAADSNANIYIASGNGDFDTTNIPAKELSDSILKISLGNTGLSLTDYFTPYDQANLQSGDVDLGSGGVLLLPDQPGNFKHELVEVGKEGTIYLVNRDVMTANNMHYCATNCSSDPQIVQELQYEIGGLWSLPAYWNNNVYFWGVGDVLKSFQLNNGHLSNSPGSSSNTSLGFPSATPSVSSNAATNGIVWAIDTTNYNSPAGPAVLHAFDATNVANELYNSTMAANNRDQAGNPAKFAVPTIANGKVYVGTQTELDVYGPLP
jgi:Bacterial Ig-like domain (group 2)